jgi:hypothetical protein
MNAEKMTITKIHCTHKAEEILKMLSKNKPFKHKS